MHKLNFIHILFYPGLGLVYYKKTRLIFQVKMCETAYFTHLQGVQNY